jgi:methionyl-tRNA formyltransferase
LGQAYLEVGSRRILVESAASFDGDEVASGSITLRNGRVALGASGGAIVLERVRPESAKSMSALSWWSGARFDHDVAQWT